MEPAADTAVRNLSNVYEGLELEDSHDSIMQEGNDEGQEQDATPVAPLPGDLLRNEFAFQHGCDGNSMQGSLQADPSTSSLAWRATGSPPYGSVHIGAPSVSGSSQAWDLAPSVAAQAEAGEWVCMHATARLHRRNSLLVQHSHAHASRPTQRPYHAWPSRH